MQHQSHFIVTTLTTWLSQIGKRTSLIQHHSPLQLSQLALDDQSHSPYANTYTGCHARWKHMTVCHLVCTQCLSQRHYVNMWNGWNGKLELQPAITTEQQQNLIILNWLVCLYEMPLILRTAFQLYDWSGDESQHQVKHNKKSDEARRLSRLM